LFPTRDYAWLAKTTESIVRLANAAPPQDAPGLAVHCESLLALTNSHARSTPAAIVPVATTAADLAPDSVFNPPSRMAMQSIISDDQESDEDVEPSPTPSDDDDDDVAPDYPLRWSQPGINDSSRVPLPPSFYRRHRTDADAASPIPTVVASPAQPIAIDPWAKIDSRLLLDRWLAVGGTPKLQIARELERRGFGTLRADVVRLAVSNDTSGRVQLVHDLLDLPGAGTKAWLLLFADDANAEVRLAAVTVMATSNDAQVLEKAWQVALHDRDPRIAGLADRLRDRRGAAHLH
jgi:hypothetical protein